MHIEHMEQNEEQDILTAAGARDFVASARYENKEERPLSCCVDGRVDESGEHTPAAKPGADAGDMMVAVGALRLLAEKSGLDVVSLRPQALEAVVESVGGPERFRFHTDAHAEHDMHDLPEEDRIARGCGHLKQAEKDPAAYMLESGDMEAIFRKLSELKKAGARESVLEGNHGERAVIVVGPVGAGIEHSTEGTQAFVYHAGYDAASRRGLAAKLARLPDVQAKGISEEDLLEAMENAAAAQRGETLVRLAGGLPIYEMNEEGAIEERGAVEVKEKAA